MNPHKSLAGRGDVTEMIVIYFRIHAYRIAPQHECRATVHAEVILAGTQLESWSFAGLAWERRSRTGAYEYRSRERGKQKSPRLHGAVNQSSGNVASTIFSQASFAPVS